MRRWSFGTAVTVLAAGLAGAVVAKVVIDGVVKLSQERRRTVEGMLATVQATVSNIVSPPEPETPTVYERQEVRAVQLPDGSTAIVTPPPAPVREGRPSWAGGALPVELGGELEDGWGDDPTDLRHPLDQYPEEWANAGRLNAMYVDPAPEAESGADHPSRVATFAPGENPLADIGERPAWETNGDS